MRTSVPGIAWLAVAALSTSVLAQVPPDPSEVGKWVASFDHPQNGDATWPTAFNAVHMSLIPVTTPGTDHRGHVIVWDITDPPATEQRWAIVDPEAQVTWNFRLPLPNSNVEPEGEGDIFCAAHTWTRSGELFVAGGSIYPAVGPTDIPSQGAKLSYLWNPREWNNPSPPINRGWHRHRHAVAALLPLHAADG